MKKGVCAGEWREGVCAGEWRRERECVLVSGGRECVL